jgi:lipopolysaccharide heptosyltransferase II
MKLPRDFRPRKILIILHGSIGDVTRALPLAGALRRGFPAAWIVWSVEPPSLPLLQGNDAIDEILIFDRPRWRRTLIGFLSGLRRRKFDLVLDLQRHFKSGLISRWSGAPFRLGFHRRDSKEFNWLFNNLYIEACGDTVSKLDHYGKFTHALGIERGELRWDFRLTTAERAAVEKHLMPVRRDFAVLFAGTRWQSKQWFPAQIAECAAVLDREFDLDSVLLGAKGDEEIARQSAAEAQVNVINLVGGTSLREAIGIIERAKLAVGPDTGLMHIAAAVATPVISLWGATDPARTGPHGFADLIIRGRAPCAPCNRRQCRIGKICLQSITSAEIADKAALVLQRRSDEDTRCAEGR